jgi:hypothetical protein
MAFCTVGADKRGATTLYSVAAHNFTQAMNHHGVRRLMFLSNFGVLGETGSTFRTALPSSWQSCYCAGRSKTAVRHSMSFEGTTGSGSPSAPWV